MSTLAPRDRSAIKFTDRYERELERNLLDGDTPGEDNPTAVVQWGATIVATLAVFVLLVRLTS